MSTYTLTVLETSGIQDYVFGSNNLAVNIGASELVVRALSDWLWEALPNPHNLRREALGFGYADLTIETHQLKAEVIYRGGGNALILFENQALAMAFTQTITRRALVEAPGLQLVAAHTSLNWKTDSLHDKFQHTLRAEVGRRKRDRRFSAPLAGLGVTAACVFTGQPATRFEKVNPAEPRRVHLSDEVAAKLTASDWAEARLHDTLPRVREKNYAFVRDFDYFGAPDESSYMAVIHADGNGMGNQLGEYITDYQTPEKNRECARRLREFSEMLERVTTQALRETVDLLIDNHDEREDVWRRKCKDEADKQRAITVHTRYQKRGDGRRQKLLPFRPLVFGGDDATFVSDGRLGLALAAEYLARCAKAKLANGRPLYSRAGVAVVKTHFPFSRAYDLADDLNGSAKRPFLGRGYPNVTALDWHFAVNGLVLGVDEVRERDYAVPKGDLTMRPVRVDGAGTDWQNWAEFKQLTTKFQTDEAWSERRNKVKALRDALRDDTVEQFRQSYLSNARLPEISDQAQAAATGWLADRCAYFDAIEAMDFFVPLEGGQA